MRICNVPEERVVNTIYMVSEFVELIFLGKGDLSRDTNKWKLNTQDIFQD